MPPHAAAAVILQQIEIGRGSRLHIVELFQLELVRSADEYRAVAGGIHNGSQLGFGSWGRWRSYSQTTDYVGVVVEYVPVGKSGCVELADKAELGYVTPPIKGDIFRSNTHDVACGSFCKASGWSALQAARRADGAGEHDHLPLRDGGRRLDAEVILLA